MKPFVFTKKSKRRLDENRATIGVFENMKKRKNTTPKEVASFDKGYDKPYGYDKEAKN